MEAGSGAGVGNGTGSGIGSGSGGGNGEGTGSGDGGTGDADLRVLDRARPPYPPAARRAGWEGAVALRVHVAADGSATSVEVRATSGHELLDEAAVKAVGRWRFSPATKAGRPIASLADLTVRFRLDDYR